MRIKAICLENNNKNDFYKKIRQLKIIRKFGYKIKVNYEGKDYTEYNDSVPKEIEDIIKIISIINAETKKEKYSKIYDYACDYLDSEFREKNLCAFKNDMCCCNRAKPKSKQVGSCCVKTSTKEVCEHFDPDIKFCKIKSITCKLFVCPHLKEKNISYPVNKILYVKHFLSIRQKLIIKSHPFVDKDEMIDKLIKFYKII